MAILDDLLNFSNNQSLVQGVGTYPSTNTIDLGVNGLPTSAAGGGARDIGIGDDPALKFLVVATSALAGAGASLQIQLMGAPDNGNGAPGNFYLMDNSPVYPMTGTYNPGARLFNVDMTRVPLGVPLPRFLQMQYIISGAAMTAGTISAYMVLDLANRIQSPTGFDSGYPAGNTVAN